MATVRCNAQMRFVYLFHEHEAKNFVVFFSSINWRDVSYDLLSMRAKFWRQIR